jgi:hypothetical protein
MYFALLATKKYGRSVQYFDGVGSLLRIAFICSVPVLFDFLVRVLLTEAAIC